MNRRDAIAAGVAIAFTPLRAFAQQPGKVWRVGFLTFQSGPEDPPFKAFRDQLRQLGYAEGRNLSIEPRWAAGSDARLQEMVADLLRLKVDVIVTRSTTATAAARRATGIIPIVMAAAANPVGAGLIASLARPGGNITGLDLNSTEIAGKLLQLLREVLPKASRFGVLGYKGSAVMPLFNENLQAAARQMGVTLVERQVQEPAEIAGAIAQMQSARAQALIVQNTAFALDQRAHLIQLTMKHRLPAMFSNRAFVDAGGFISYAASIPEMYRRAAFYVDRIFRGANPADLPVEQPTKFDLVINLKTAKALGLTIPQSVLLRADEVIQ